MCGLCANIIQPHIAKPMLCEGAKNINYEFRNRNKQKDFTLWVQTP